LVGIVLYSPMHRISERLARPFSHESKSERQTSPSESFRQLQAVREILFPICH